MAQQLVSAMTGEFDPAQYKDEYREALETIIEAKVEGKETVAVEAPEESGKLIDLMAALEASVNAAKAAASRAATSRSRVAEAKAAKAGRKAAASRRPKRPTTTAEETPAKPAAEAQDRLTGRAAGRRRPRCGTLTRCPSRNTAASATSRRPRSRRRHARRARRARRVAAASSSSATARPGSTTTSGSRSTASSCRGPSRRARPSIPASAGWPSTSRTTRSSTSTSRASSRRKQYGAGDVIVWDWGTWEAEAPTVDATDGDPRRRAQVQPRRPEAQRPLHDRPDERPPAQGRRSRRHAPSRTTRASSGC